MKWTVTADYGIGTVQSPYLVSWVRNCA